MWIVLHLPGKICWVFVRWNSLDLATIGHFVQLLGSNFWQNLLLIHLSILTAELVLLLHWHLSVHRVGTSYRDCLDGFFPIRLAGLVQSRMLLLAIWRLHWLAWDALMGLELLLAWSYIGLWWMRWRISMHLFVYTHAVITGLISLISYLRAHSILINCTCWQTPLTTSSLDARLARVDVSLRWYWSIVILSILRVHLAWESLMVVCMLLVHAILSGFNQVAVVIVCSRLWSYSAHVSTSSLLLHFFIDSIDGKSMFHNSILWPILS